MRKVMLIGISLGLILVAITLAGAYITITKAEDLPTNLNVNNSPPSITAGPAESTASTGTTPTDEGTDVTFTATANEPNGENYYLAICNTDSITGGSSGSAPTCDGGAWCVSTSTSSDTQASCSHTTVDGDPESNAWYAFVCDNNSTSEACSSTGDQGSGDSGSPFFVNHDPSFTAIVDDGGSGTDSGANPGGTMTFTATASDPDTDTVKLVVCADTNGATSAGCSGTQICASTSVASNPTCNTSIPTVAQDGSFNYYAYLFDSHDLASGSNYLSGAYTINNVAPTVTSVTINGGSDIDLTESTTTNVVVTGTVTDNNSCQDLVTVESSVYRSSVTYSGCDTDAEDDNNDCYAQVTCTVAGTDTCDSATDAVADYTCTVPVQFHADPTITSTPYVSDTWLSTINAEDSALSDNTEVAAGVEINTLNAIDITSNPIDYGTLSVGESNTTMTEDIRVSMTGNIGSDLELSGTNMSDGGSGTINVNNQKYAFCHESTYASDGTTLTGSAVEEEINVAKTRDSSNPSWRDLFWGLEIPSDTIPGSYSGTNTVTSVMDEATNWDYEAFCMDSGLIAHWEMNEASWNGTTNEVVDSSGSGYDGTAQGNATTAAVGVDRSGSFDGTVDGNYVIVGDIDELDSATEFTITGWVYQRTLDRWRTIFAKGNVYNNKVVMQIGHLGDGGGADDAYLTVSNGGNSFGWTNGNILSTNEWNHWAMVYDGSQSNNANKLKFYLNGIQKSMGYNGTIPSVSNSNSESGAIGFETLCGAGYCYHDGYIDDLRIYDHVLTQYEISILSQYVPDN